jgi:hypothetical protein
MLTLVLGIRNRISVEHGPCRRSGIGIGAVDPIAVDANLGVAALVEDYFRY